MRPPTSRAPTRLAPLRTVACLLVAGMLSACADAPAPKEPARASPPPPPPPRPLPAARHGHCVVRCADGLLCIGGYGRGARERSKREVLFLADAAPSQGDARAWTGRAPMPTPRAFFAAAAAGGRVFAIGDGVDAYDPAADRWTTLAGAALLPRSHFGAGAHDGRLFVLGGFPERGTGLTIVDVATGAVTAAEPPPDHRAGDHFAFVVSLAGALHVLGGVGGDVLEMRRAHWVRSRDGDWRRLGDAPDGLWAKFAAHAVVDGRLYLFGDFGGYRYDPADDSWMARARMPNPVAMPQAVVGDGAIWVLGGMRVGERENVFYRYDVAADRWTLPR